jgi:hypothetical protein
LDETGREINPQIVRRLLPIHGQRGNAAHISRAGDPDQPGCRLPFLDDLRETIEVAAARASRLLGNVEPRLEADIRESGDFMGGGHQVRSARGFCIGASGCTGGEPAQQYTA